MTPERRTTALRLIDYWSADDWPGGLSRKEIDETVTLLRELVAEPESKPVAYVHEWKSHANVIGRTLQWHATSPHGNDVKVTPLYQR